MPDMNLTFLSVELRARVVDEAQGAQAPGHTTRPGRVRDASKSWDLRCEMREKLVALIQNNYSGSRPLLRTTFERGLAVDTRS